MPEKIHIDGGGELQDIEQLYKLYHKQLYTYLFYLAGGDEQLAEELLQETFYQAVLSSVRYRGDAKVSSWLYQIAKYTFYKYKNQRKRTVPVAEIYRSADELTPEQIHLKKATREKVLQAVNMLPDNYRDVIILRIYNELSFRETASALNRTENWAKVNFYRAKAKLRKLLDGGGDD